MNYYEKYKKYKSKYLQLKGGIDPTIECIKMCLMLNGVSDITIQDTTLQIDTIISKTDIKSYSVLTNYIIIINTDNINIILTIYKPLNEYILKDMILNITSYNIVEYKCDIKTDTHIDIKTGFINLLDNLKNIIFEHTYLIDDLIFILNSMFIKTANITTLIINKDNTINNNCNIIFEKLNKIHTLQTHTELINNINTVITNLSDVNNIVKDNKFNIYDYYTIKKCDILYKCVLLFSTYLENICLYNNTDIYNNIINSIELELSNKRNISGNIYTIDKLIEYIKNLNTDSNLKQKERSNSFYSVELKQDLKQCFKHCIIIINILKKHLYILRNIQKQYNKPILFKNINELRSIYNKLNIYMIDNINNVIIDSPHDTLLKSIYKNRKNISKLDNNAQISILFDLLEEYKNKNKIHT